MRIKVLGASVEFSVRHIRMRAQNRRSRDGGLNFLKSLRLSLEMAQMRVSLLMLCANMKGNPRKC